MRIFYSVIIALFFINIMSIPADAEESEVVFYTRDDLGRQPEGKTSYYWYTPGNKNYEEIVKDGVKVVLNSPSTTSSYIYNSTNGFDLVDGWGFTIYAPEGKKIVKVELGDSRLSSKSDFSAVVTDAETWDADKRTWSGSASAITFTHGQSGSLKLPANTTKVPQAIAFTVALKDDENDITTVFYGDANNDGKILIDDVYAEVEYILGKTPDSFSKKNADVNCDGKINVVDVSETIDLILKQNINTTNKPVANGFTQAGDGLVVTNGENNTLNIALDNIENISALQADIMLPAGIRVNQISAANDLTHSFSCAQLSNGCIRFVIYSMELKNIAANQDLVMLTFEFDKSFTDGYAQISNIFAVGENSGPLNFQTVNAEISNSSSTDMIINDSNEKYYVYNMQGVLVGKSCSTEDVKQLPPNTYILQSRNKSSKVIIR